MESGQTCTRHAAVDAVFICARCADPYCADCRCELLDGSVCCADCAVDAAGENRGEFAAPHGAGFTGLHRPERTRRRARFLVLVLLVAVPLLAAELIFLHRSTTQVSGPEIEARRVMGDTLALVTVLNRYKAETGSYPERLEQIVPTHWDPGDTAELAGYDYRRVGSDRFSLWPRLTGDGREDAGITAALALIPSSLGEDSRLEMFLKPDQLRAEPPPPGEGL